MFMVHLIVCTYLQGGSPPLCPQDYAPSLAGSSSVAGGASPRSVLPDDKMSALVEVRNENTQIRFYICVCI